VWVEVLAQWQGLAYVSANNKSFFGNYSTALTNPSVLTSVNNFVPPSNVASALFVVWCNNADFVSFTQIAPSPPYVSGQIPQWTTLINQSIDRHKTAINTLYAKGARTIIMPKAANIAATPYYSFLGSTNKLFIKQRTIEYNLAFDAAIAAHVATRPGLTVYRPDVFALVEQVLATPSAFGITNTTSYALLTQANRALTTASPGASFLFWDDTHPSAKFQMHLADLVQQMISPVAVNGISRSGNTSQITIENVPLSLTGALPSPRNGIIEGSSNLQPPWVQDVVFSRPFSVGGSTTATVSATSTAPSRFYRVSFPVVWTWP
jgi:phospholipase/lecithinase/hemolysin